MIKPFTPMKLEEERAASKEKVFTIKMNKAEYEAFQEWKNLIQQSKDSTALKQLAKVGAIVLHSEKERAILEIVLNNYRKNKRLGVVAFD